MHFKNAKRWYSERTIRIIGKNIKFPDKLASLALITNLIELEERKTNQLCPKCNNELAFMKPANNLLYYIVCN